MNGSQLFINVRTCDPQLDTSLDEDECFANPGHAALLGVQQKENSWLNLPKISR